MNRRNAIILGVAALLGVIAVYLANTWFTGVEQAQERVAEENNYAQIVVARQELGFGAALTRDNLQMVNWPADSVPAGSFSDTNELLSGTRVALRDIAVGEPILAQRVSGLDGRATLSANIPRDMRAVSIPVGAVTGVSGFVIPGDVVDIFLSRQIPGAGSGDGDQMTAVLLENVKVVGVNQRQNERETSPLVGDTATVLVDQFGAQKLVLAQRLGTLSLALRNVENQDVGATKVATTRDLPGRGLYVPERRSSAAAPAQQVNSPATNQPVRRTSGPTMTVIRGTEGTVYEVNSHGR